MIRWLVDNLSAFALALILAVFVWFVATRETNPIQEQPYWEPVPVQLLNQPPGTVFTTASGAVLNSAPREFVQVVIRGPKLTLAALQPADFSAAVDLSTVAYGGADVPVKVEIMNSLVTIVNQDLDTITIRLEEYRRLTLPLVPDILGQPALGHVAGEPVVDPTEMVLEGTASQVDRVDHVGLELSIEGARETVQRTVTARLRDSRGLPVLGFDTSLLQVSVTVPITKSDEYTELFVTVNLTGTIAVGHRLVNYSVEPQRVTIFGPPEIVSSLPNFVSTLPVDVSNASADVLQRVGLMVPPGVTVIGAQNVLVEIDIEPVVTTLTIPWRPQILGPDAGLTVTISPETVNISVVGPLSLTQAFDPEKHLSVTLNLFGKEPGSYQIAPEALSTLIGVEVVGILPPTLLVEIILVPTPTPTPTPSTTLTTTLTVSPGATGTLFNSPIGTPTP